MPGNRRVDRQGWRRIFATARFSLAILDWSDRLIFLGIPGLVITGVTTAAAMLTELPVWALVLLFLFGGMVVLGVSLGLLKLIQSSRLDPDAEYLHGETIHIAQLARASGYLISEKTFDSCRIIGPAILCAAPDSSINSISGSHFDGLADDLMYVLDERTKANRGLVWMQDCVFRRCRFENIGLAGSEEVVNTWRMGIKDGSTG